MFRLAIIEDDIPVQPSNLNKPAMEAVKDGIESRYLDTVVPGVGLVVSLYSIDEIEGDFIYPSEGAVRYKVIFHLVVFHPTVHQVLHGTITSSSREGLWVSVGFFGDVFVPDSAFHEGSGYRVDEGLWVWNYKGENPEEQVELFYDVGMLMRLKVSNMRFPQLPPPPELQTGAAEDKIGTLERPYRPMIVEAAVNEEGLGLCDWWKEDEDGA